MRKYDQIRIEPAENGYILKCCKQEKDGVSDSQFVNMSYKPLEWVFPKGKEKELIANLNFPQNYIGV